MGKHYISKTNFSFDVLLSSACLSSACLLFIAFQRVNTSFSLQKLLSTQGLHLITSSSTPPHILCWVLLISTVVLSPLGFLLLGLSVLLSWLGWHLIGFSRDLGQRWCSTTTAENKEVAPLSTVAATTDFTYLLLALGSLLSFGSLGLFLGATLCPPLLLALPHLLFLLLQPLHSPLLSATNKPHVSMSVLGVPWVPLSSVEYLRLLYFLPSLLLLLALLHITVTLFIICQQI
ncbi:hypothetical protein BC826DRAFT_973114 [Russula brevipes]|nr:hypothetical protein BC826DRAFT_973114 [Russula brevipes]